MILEKNPLKLETDWFEGTDNVWDYPATVKIFSTREEYENYQLENEEQKMVQA